MIKLPKVIWAHIRSFSGDTGYEPTPTAKLISRDLVVRDDSAGTWQFPFGRDGYASTVVLAFSPAFFLKREPWRWEFMLPSSYIRILHLNYDGRGGYPIRASQRSE